MNRQPFKESSNPIDIHVGALVKEQRIYKGWSQTRLGDALEVSFQQIQKYENGSNRISASSLYKLAEALGVDVGYFFKGLSAHGPGMEEAPGGYVHEPVDTTEAIQLKKYFYKITDVQVRNRLFHLIKTLSTEFEG